MLYASFTSDPVINLTLISWGVILGIIGISIAGMVVIIVRDIITGRGTRSQEAKNGQQA